MMDDQHLPNSLRLRLREYFREGRHMMRVQGYSETVGMMSVPLRGEVALHTCACSRG